MLLVQVSTNNVTLLTIATVFMLSYFCYTKDFSYSAYVFFCGNARVQCVNPLLYVPQPFISI